MRVNVYDYSPRDYAEDPVLAGWFDPDRADQFDESTHWDGQNMTSDVAGEFEHEILYRTKGGRWVLNHWSQWQGSQETYQFVSDDRAREWLLICGHDQAVEQHFGKLEEERGPGRPEVGPAINVRLPEDMLTALDARAEADGIPRAEAIRRALATTLGM